MNTFIENVEDQQSQTSSQDNNAVPKKETKRKFYHSSTKVKARNLLTNVSYRRLKQPDFYKDCFVIDILSFMVQNFNPVNLDIKLDIEKERDMVKLMWDVCVPNEFVSFMLKWNHYNLISQPNLTYQKANNIVKAYLAENKERISTIKYKLEEKFELIHYTYSFLYVKIYNRINPFGIQRKTDFDFQFQMWRKEKSQKVIAKEPSNFVDRKVEKMEQAPIDVDEKLSVKAEKIKKKRKVLETKLEQNTQLEQAMKKLNKVNK